MFSFGGDGETIWILNPGDVRKNKREFYFGERRCIFLGCRFAPLTESVVSIKETARKD